MFKCGSIVLVNNKKSLFSKIIKWVTSSNYSHCAITMGNLIPKSESILTAEWFILTHPLQRYFENKDYDIEIYEIQNIAEQELENIVIDLYNARVNRGYAFWQNLWFIYRYLIAEKLGFDVRRQGNWFPKSDNCSEETYDLLKKVTEVSVHINTKLIPMGYKLSEWNSNCFSPKDAKIIINKFPENFKLAYESKNA